MAIQVSVGQPPSLLREGAHVAISYLHEEEADAKEVVALILAEGRKAIPLPGDITSEDWCREGSHITGEVLA